MRKIDFIQKFGEGFIAVGMSDTLVRKSISVHEVRGSVRWPVDGFPGYYLIMAKKKKINEHGKRPMLFLAEGENQSPSLMLEALSDDLVRLKCAKLYAKQDRTHRGIEGFYKDLYHFIKKRKIGTIVVPSPSVNDPEYGRALIKEYIKDQAFDVPKLVPTILREHLGSITDAMPAEKYAFHALRYLMAGFEKFDDVRQSFFPVNKEAQKEKAERRWAAYGS